VLGELARELPDRRRLPGPVHADDEHDRGRVSCAGECRRLAEELLDLLRQRLAEVGELAARLEPADELRRRRDTDVRSDQGDLELLPRVLAGCVERACELRRERAPALPQRLAEPAQEPAPLLRLARPVLDVPQQLRPRARHRANATRVPGADI
jgi:hypothetical protein